MKTLCFQTKPQARSQRLGVMFSSSFAFFLILAATLGCSNQDANKESLAVVEEDPEGEFAWGMERLERTLRLHRPTGAEGIITTSTLEHELTPPDDDNPRYTARVTILTKSSFMHGRREFKKEIKQIKERKALEFEDLLDSKKKDEPIEIVDIPGAGPQASTEFVPSVESRSLDKKTVFDLVYRDGRWQLTKQPELKHELLWFKYAFQQD